MRKLIYIGIIALFFTSCDYFHTSDERKIEATANAFATKYFNWHFEEALPYCTPESEIWLRYAASQVHQADIDSLRAQKEGASADIDDINIADNDSIAQVGITVHNYLRMDTIGNACRKINEAKFLLDIRRRSGHWKVRMVNLLRSED